MLRRLVLASIFTIAISAKPAQANPEREFLMACTYGVLAGTLVGAASLAFTDQPGDNLRNVARGASLGLYLGMGLGLYVVYVVPSQLEQEQQQELYDEPVPGEEGVSLPRLNVFPMLSQTGSIDGMAATYRLMDF